MIRLVCAAAIAFTLASAGAAPAGAQPAPGSEPSGEPPPAPDSATPAPTGEDDEDGDDEGGGSLLESDVEPTLSVVRTDAVEVRVGGLVQVHAAPYVGDEALVENGDPATRPGFRLRRSRVGFEGRFKEPLRIELVIDLLEADEDEGSVSDAKLYYDWRPELRFSLGVGKVAFARGSLESSRRLPVIERPLVVTEIAPDRRLGANLEGAVLGGNLVYVAGVANGSEGFADGNEFGGFLAGGRVQYFVLGTPRGLDVEEGVSVGASGYYENAPATNGFALSADLTANFAGATLVVEGLCDTRTPDESPEVAPTIADEITRCGGYGTALYDLPGMPLPLQPAVRVELLDDNTEVEDAGDAWQVSGGVNSMLIDPNLRAQLHYTSRIERHGPARSNDSVVLAFTGVF
ncbi:MAG TPA: porin [Kofleriaceae bacterium]|nr:porin [Kofleriaceae bacterium]